VGTKTKIKNKCKHSKTVVLLWSGVRGIKVEWCKECGVTRYHNQSYTGISPHWNVGKWKSPEIELAIPKTKR
jgi:hypothetical protein